MAAPYEDVASVKELREGDPFEVWGSIFKLYKGSLEAFKLNWLTFVVLYFLPTVLAALAIPLVILPALSGSRAGGLFAVLVTLVLMAIILVLGPAYTVTQFESVRGRKIDFEAAFQRGTKYVVRYVLLSFAIFFMIALGLVLLVIPGLLVAFFLGAAPYLLVARNLSISEALRQSYELTKVYWKPVAGVFIVLAAINALGIIPIFGGALSIAATILYLCVPAMIVTRIIESDHATTTKKATTIDA